MEHICSLPGVESDKAQISIKVLIDGSHSHTTR